MAYALPLRYVATRALPYARRALGRAKPRRSHVGRGRPGPGLYTAPQVSARVSSPLTLASLLAAHSLRPVSLDPIASPGPLPRTMHSPARARAAAALASPRADLRSFDPTRRSAPVPAITKAASRLVAARGQPVVQFAAPPQVSPCVRRGIRREVLFSRKRPFGHRRGPRRRNQWSDVKC